MAKILIVDDSITVICSVSQLLEKQGHQVLTAANGNEAVMLAHQQKPDLILMDVGMPVMNGFQAVRQLSRDNEAGTIPVVIIGVRDQETQKQWARRQGAVAYLVKPIDEETLLTVINDILNR